MRLEIRVAQVKNIMKTALPNTYGFRWTSRSDARQAFTLIELLVVVSIIALLASMLLPALANAKNKATRISCTANLKQLGVGLFLYSDQNNDRLPPAKFDPEGAPASGPYQSVWMFFGQAGKLADTTIPMNLAYLYTSALIAQPKTYYDPGLRHDKSLPIGFEMAYYVDPKLGWPVPKKRLDDQGSVVRNNYPYYPQSSEPAKKNPARGEEEWSRVAFKYSQLVSTRSIVTDLIHTTRTRPHTSNRNPVGMNALWGDSHVSFSTTKAAFDPKLWDPGDDYKSQQNPGDVPWKFRTIVSLLRP